MGFQSNMLQCIFKAYLFIECRKYIKIMIRMIQKQPLSACLGHSVLYTKIICKRFFYASNIMKCENSGCFPRPVAKMMRNAVKFLSLFCFCCEARKY